MRSKKILVLGGKPIASCDIVKYARQMGVYTIVTDNLNIKESPAKQIADESWNISTADTAMLQKMVVKNNIGAVFTGVHEFNIKKTMELAYKCNLPFYATPQQLEITSIKNLYKNLFKNFGLPVVSEYQVENEEEIEFPVLVKPVDGSGGYGISICNNFDELQIGVKHAKEISNKGEILIEKYLNSKEVTIFYIIQNGSIFLSAMADRITYSFKDDVIPLPVLYNFPSRHLDLFIKGQNDKTIKALKSIGLNNGMLFIQAFIEDDKFVYYDIGYRLTGTQEYNILEKVCGYNPLKMMVDFALSGKMGNVLVESFVDPYFKGKFACNITFLCNPGKILKFIGIKKIKMYPGVIKSVINHEVGETIPISAIGTLNQVVFRVFAITNSKTEMNALKTFIYNTFDVISDNFKSLLISVK